MSETTPGTAYDEEYAPDGTLTKRTARQVPDRPPSDVELMDLRRQLRAVLRSPLTPAWGKVIARALLLYTWMDNDPSIQETAQPLVKITVEGLASGD